MIQWTLERLKDIRWRELVVVCNEEHRLIANDQILETGMKGFSIILEPVPRNTAPAIALAAFHAMEEDDEAVLLVLPADHLITDVHEFQNALEENALPAAKRGRLVTFGIAPSHPETGYGYIKKGKTEGPNIYEVASFTEKPDRETAAQYVRNGGYYWNSGMFLFQASTFLKELRTLAPGVYANCRKAVENSTRDENFIRIDEKTFSRSPSISIDYAVMEGTNRASVVPLDIKWSDIGCWTSLWETCETDGLNNYFQGDIQASATENSFVLATSRKVGTIGIRDLVVIETRDAVLVAHKDHVPKVAEIAGDLERGKPDEQSGHREINRPWGAYSTLEAGEGFKVKRIRVNPGAKLSLQIHEYRAENWVVIKGQARAIIDEHILTLAENESAHIPAGKAHSLENPGKEQLEVIEVQTGCYLGEDDILRLEDMYGRC
jgi:mannose-1-phosphate guanylyltransferase